LGEYGLYERPQAAAAAHSRRPTHQVINATSYIYIYNGNLSATGGKKKRVVATFKNAVEEHAAAGDEGRAADVLAAFAAA